VKTSRGTPTQIMGTRDGERSSLAKASERETGMERKLF
jgi:hypothetical protein